MMSEEDRSCLIMKSMSTCLMKRTQCGPKQLCSLYKTLMLIMEKRHFAWEHKDKAPEQWMKVMWSKKRGQQSDAPIMPSARCVSLWGCVVVWSRSVGHFRTSMAQRTPKWELEQSSGSEYERVQNFKPLRVFGMCCRRLAVQLSHHPYKISGWILQHCMSLSKWCSGDLMASSKLKVLQQTITEKTFDLISKILYFTSVQYY